MRTISVHENSAISFLVGQRVKLEGRYWLVSYVWPSDGEWYDVNLLEDK